jgi:signal transduction histidine kinase
MAARVHDSVLQTLALIQRESGDARRVATLARRQERELRGWLYREPGLFEEEGVASAVEAAAAEVEDVHGVRVEVVVSGDAPLDDDLRALVLAAREAMTNAAKFSGTDEVSVYVEAAADGATVFVRDRGVGFDRAAVPTDRRGLAESIEGRLARHGGTARISSVPGDGTEVELTVRRAEG